ncbi:MAG: hypothetical protein HFJ21_03990 [Clostridia bacterium]|jgi:F0F1-type ATP synthase membrane subunit b/b'|nr:hypothetical protein [Clostridia bacterium]MCI9459606.1 hypothetical protein [Clostridia bacterium]
MQDNDALDILNELRTELGGSRGLFSKKPDIELCSELCDKLARVLPDSINEAEYVKQKRKEILSNADVVAKNTIRVAEEKAERIASESEVVKKAQIDAKQIIENAYTQCDNLILRTKAHLDNMFKETEQFLLSTLSVVRTNREELRSALVDDTQKR